MGFGWISVRPAWQTMRAWHETQAAFRSNFESDSAYLINKMTTAATDQINGAANLALRVAQKRIRAAVTAKINKLV